MKDKKWEEISDRLMVIERKLDNFFSERLKEISETSEEPLKPFDYDDAWKSCESEPEREDSKVGFLNEAILSCTEEDIEKWNKNEIKKRDILARDVLDNGFDTTYTTATAKQMEVETDILLRKRFLMEVISSLESTLRSIKCGEDCGFERTIIELLEDMGYGNLYSMLPKRLKILSSEDWANFNKNIDNITV